MKWRIIFILCFSFLLFHYNGFSQCCSPGNPVGGTGNLGVLAKDEMKIMATYRHSYSGKYMDGSKVYEPYFVETGYFNHTGFLFAYGVSNRVTLEIESGYFISKGQSYVEGIIPAKKKGYGLTNISFTPKVMLLNKNDWEITMGLGLKYPIGAYNKAFNGAIAELDIQPSTGAVDYIHTLFISKEYLAKHLRFFLYNRVEIKTANPLQYKYGNLYSTSFYMSYSASFRWDLITQVRSEIRSKDERPGQVSPYDIQKIPISGSKKVFIAPQINYNINESMNISILVDLPIYQYYNKQQLASSYSMLLSITKKFKKKENGEK